MLKLEVEPIMIKKILNHYRQIVKMFSSCLKFQKLILEVRAEYIYRNDKG